MGGGGEEDISIHISQPQSVKIERYIHHLETEGITRVKMYIVITTAYLIFWAPLFLVGFHIFPSSSPLKKKESESSLPLHLI